MSRIITTGIASFGMSGKIFHAPFIQQHPLFKLSAIVERHRDESRSKYPESKLYRSFEELIADDEIELIVVNTPVQTHFEYAKAALNAGKAIVVEKPFTVSAQEAQELDELAKSKNLFLSVYQNRRYDGDFLAIKDVLDKNLLGEIKEAELRFDRYRTGHSGKDHKEGNKPGAGNLHDLGAHLIDQAIQLFGFPSAVFADMATMRKDLESNDYFEVLMYYTSGLRVRVKGSVFIKEISYAYMIYGENGSFLQKRSDLQEERLASGAIPSVDKWIETPEEPDGILHYTENNQDYRTDTRSAIGNYMNYYQDVYDALTGTKSNPVPAADAVKTMTIIDAAFQSNKEKSVINL